MEREGMEMVYDDDDDDDDGYNDSIALLFLTTDYHERDGSEFWGWPSITIITITLHCSLLPRNFPLPLVFPLPS